MTSAAKTILMTSPIELVKNLLPGDSMIPRLSQQWSNLRNACASAGADVVIVPPDSADMFESVLVANRGLILGGRMLPSVSNDSTKIGAAAYFTAWCKSKGFSIFVPTISPEISPTFAGASDALFDQSKNVLLFGYGYSSSKSFIPQLEAFLDQTEIKLLSLKLVSPLNQNLDLVLCPLQNGWALWYPSAFNKESQDAIIQLYGDKLIEISQQEAFISLSCSSVVIGDFIVTPKTTEATRNALFCAGLQPIQVDVSLLANRGGLKRLFMDVIE